MGCFDDLDIKNLINKIKKPLLQGCYLIRTALVHFQASTKRQKGCYLIRLALSHPEAIGLLFYGLPLIVLLSLNCLRHLHAT